MGAQIHHEIKKDNAAGQVTFTPVVEGVPVGQPGAPDNATMER
jgi:hypothetical protein